MQHGDFLGTSSVEKNIVNRKKDVHKVPVSWLKAREIILETDKPNTIFISSTFNGAPQEVNIEKKSPGRRPSFLSIGLDPLWPTGKPISPAKLADIKSLMHLIPGDAKQFYKNLIAADDVTDDIEGYGGNIDFVIDNDITG